MTTATTTTLTLTTEMVLVLMMVIPNVLVLLHGIEVSTLLIIKPSILGVITTVGTEPSIHLVSPVAVAVAAKVHAHVHAGHAEVAEHVIVVHWIHAHVLHCSLLVQVHLGGSAIDSLIMLGKLLPQAGFCICIIMFCIMGLFQSMPIAFCMPFCIPSKPNPLTFD